MKDRKRKNRNWEKDCRIMKKYGSNLRKEIEKAFKKTLYNQVKHKELKRIAKALKVPEGAHKDISEKVTWNI